IGGEFLLAGKKARKNLLHVDANGEVLPLQIQIDGPIKDIMLRGDSLYIAGAFTEIDGQKRVGAAVIDIQTGLLLNWDAYLYAADVEKMEVYKNVLFLGGQSHQRIFRYSYRYPVLAVDLQTGHLLPREDWQWLYDVWGTNNYTLAAENISLEGDHLAVQEDEARVFHLPSQQEIFNEARGFNFMDLHDGYLYVGSITSLAKIELVNPSNRDNFFISGAFTDIAYTDSSIWLAGFIRLNQANGSDIPVSAAEFLKSDNTFTGNKILTVGIVNNLTNSSTGFGSAIKLEGSQVILGGHFDGLGALERNNFYEFDLSTQSPTDWQPNPNGRVREIKSHEGRVYVGGDFTEIEGQAISGMAVFDSARQILPDFSYLINGSVYDFAFNDTNVYIAGDFDNVGNYNNKNLFSVNKTTGQIQNFEPDPAAYVERLVMLDTVLFLEGRFSSLMDTSIVGRKSCPEGIAYIDPNTAHPYWCHREFQRDESNFGQISSYQGEMYVLSRRAFPYVGKNYLLKFNPLTLDMDTLNYLDLNGDIWQYKFACDRLHLFGDFTEVNGEKEHQFAIIDLNTNQVFDQFNNPDSTEASEIDGGLYPINEPMLIHQGKWYHSFYLQNNRGFMNRESIFRLNMEDIPAVPGSTLSLNFSYQTNGYQVQFQNQSSTTAVDYFWDFGDGNISYQYSPLHTYAQAGTYTVKFIAANECNTDTLSSQVQINFRVGLDLLPKESLKLYPNPSQGKITVEFKQTLDKDTRIRVLDPRGKSVFMEKLGPQGSNSSIELDFPELPNGIYVLMLEQKGARLTKKFVIQR
ncbi:MAG: T9SS type A sorting domain-containing protein, partial [Bacteroidota bacterium]